MYDLAREITHGSRTSIDPNEYLKQEKRAEEFLKVMLRLTDDLLKREKIIKIERKELV